MQNDIYKGYIASRSIGNLFIPQRIQNLVIRTYAEKNRKKFSLSAVEYIMENSFIMLNALVKDAQNFEALVFYSLHMLPDHSEDRLRIFHACLDLGTEIHFAYEELVIRTKNDIQLIEDIVLAKSLSGMTLDPAQFLQKSE